ncbi:MAG: phage minor capsid protein, partial [Candidatus Fonsibacter sp.]
FNKRLYDLCIGLPSSRVSKTGDLNYKLRVINNRSNLVPKYVPLNSTKIVGGVTKTVFELKKFDFVMIQQEISSIAFWNPVAPICFASSLLPIKSTQTSLPNDVGINNNFTGSGNNSNLLSTITNFTIAVDGNNQYRPMVVYIPSAEYRLIDMNSSMNLNRIDIIVYWNDTFGNIHPFELHPGCSANVKLMFRRKDFNTNS